MDSYEKLKSLFISNIPAAIEESQKIICSFSGFNSFKNFYSYHLQHPHISTCQKEWTTEQMAIHCNDCSTSPNSCICLECFLQGNHEGHDYIIRPDLVGNCDCGDYSLWKGSGFCKNHQGVEENSHPENYIDEKLRTILTDTVFKAALSSLKEFRKEKDGNVDQILQFLSTFLQFGDGFRRLISISLIEKVDFKFLLYNIFDSSSEFNESFQDFCGKLINDEVFRNGFAQIVYKLIIEKIMPIEFDSLVKHKDQSNLIVWDEFWFHVFDQKPVEDSIKYFNWDWVSFILHYSEEAMKYLKYVDCRDFIEYPSVFDNVNSFAYYASTIQSIEQTQRLFDELFTQVLNKDKNKTVLLTSFMDSSNETYFWCPYLFNLVFYDFFNCFSSKENLKFDKLIEELDKTIDISPIFCFGNNSIGESNENENDRFILPYIKQINNESRSIKDNYFKSFHNGASFFFSFPLYDSLVQLFKNDDMTRLKIGQFFSMDQFQNLRIQLGIITLKKILSFVCYYQSLTPKSNHGLNTIYQLINSPDYFYLNLPNYLPLLQLFIGIECKEKNTINDFSLKEFFAFEMAREIGLFDNFNSKNYKYEDVNEREMQMIFSILYLSILFVIERTLFNYDIYKYIEEQVIFGLKNGHSHLDELNKIVSHQFTNSSYSQQKIFNEIIANVTKKRDSSTKNIDDDSKFYLKDGIEWKTITALNPLNNQKVLLNDEILKHPNELIKIPEFEPEETFFFNKDATCKIKLKEFLLTPTILATVYYTLRNKDKPNVSLNDHLAMNILILASKFVDENDNSSNSSSFNKSTIIHYDSSLADLISNFKRILFNLKIDGNGNATIKNSLNKISFISFLQIKIVSEDQEPKSFIDILQEKGEIGKKVLKKMSIDIGNEKNDNQNNGCESHQIKKEQAKKLKESIMNQYSNAMSSFNLDQDSLNTNEEVCSICSTTNDDILSYPVFMYKTKFPFIVDKPPIIRVDSANEIGVDEDPGYSIKNDDEEEEEEEMKEEEEINQDVHQENHDLIIDQHEHEIHKVDLSHKNEKEITKRCTFGNNFVVQYGICQHPIHPNCINNNIFQCPIDKSIKNGFLPIIDSLPKESILKNKEKNIYSDEVQKSISIFIQNFVDFSFEQFTPDFIIIIELVKSISGLIVTYEVRLRNLPDCLNHKEAKILTRNLFLTTWHWYRMQERPTWNENEVESRLTVFQKFIKKLIECDEIEKYDVFKGIVSSFINSPDFTNLTDIERKNKEIFLFLKRVCLAEYFVLNINEIEEDNFVDWDEKLSLSNLSKHYNFEFIKMSDKEFEIKKFKFINFPKDFLHLALKPFNFPIVETTKLNLFNIIDYNYLIKTYDNFNDVHDENGFLENNKKNIMSFKSFNSMIHMLRSNYAAKDYPSLFIYLGKHASRLFLVNDNCISNFNPFYLDKYGCFDIGFERNQPLFLDEERYLKVIDDILSGKFTKYFNNF